MIIDYQGDANLQDFAINLYFLCSSNNLFIKNNEAIQCLRGRCQQILRRFNKTYAIFNIMKKEIKETLDSKGKYRCVRFDTGEVGMVDEEGNALMVLGQWDRLKFSTHGFLKITNHGHDIYMDSKNGELYAHMPEFMHVGNFELALIGGYMCTRTKKIYE